MKGAVRCGLTILALLIDMLILNPSIDALYNSLFDILFVFSPLLIFIKYVKPVLIIFILNNRNLFKNYKKNLTNIWISVVIFIVVSLVFCNKLIGEGDFWFFDIVFYSLDCIFSAILLTIYHRNTGDGKKHGNTGRTQGTVLCVDEK